MKNKIDLKQIPNTFGVYLFKEQNKILYVGKAKNIRNRIKQYLSGSINSYKTPLLMEKIDDIEFIVCSNEKESLLLEQELIKKYKPHFNILFLDDKKYPYIVISIKNNKLEFDTKFFYKKDKKSFYYGPLPQNYGYKTIKNFLIRECLYKNGLPIKLTSKEEIEEKFNYAKKILSSSNKEILEKLKNQMQLASENEQYELALELRDTIKFLSNRNENQSISFDNEKNFEIIAFLKEENYFIINVHYFKNGTFFMQEDFIIEQIFDENETITSFINYFYSIRNQSNLIITNYDFNQHETIFDGEKIIPKKGKFFQALTNCLKNANLIKEQKILKLKQKNETVEKVKLFLKEKLNKEINDFIMIDNSWEKDKDISSVVIYYKNFIPFFSNYRKYNLTSQKLKMKRHADVEYMKIGIEKYLEKEEHPDLIIVDGGIHHVNEIKKVLEKLNLKIKIFGLSKDTKHSTDKIIFENGKEEKIQKKEIFNFFAKVQNEVDLYAKKQYQKLNINSSLEGFLSSIKGIGPSTEKKLIDYFGTYTKIYNASFEELTKVVSKNIANKIIEKLKK